MGCLTHEFIGWIKIWLGYSSVVNEPGQNFILFDVVSSIESLIPTQKTQDYFKCSTETMKSIHIFSQIV